MCECQKNSKYRFHTGRGLSPYKVQEKKWWGWKTVYSSIYSYQARQVLKWFRKQERGENL